MPLFGKLQAVPLGHVHHLLRFIGTPYPVYGVVVREHPSCCLLNLCTNPVEGANDK